MLQIREASEVDLDKIWPIFQAIASAGDTYAYPMNVTRAEGRRLWLDTPRKTFVAEDDDEVLGTYYIKTNQAGPGAHVCNCGYMVAADARGRGNRHRHVQTFAGCRPGTGLRGHAVQLRCVNQRGRRPALAEARL